MPSKRKSCQNWKLYVITDPAGKQKRPLEETVRLAIEGGASVIQLRDKNASNAEMITMANTLLKITRPAGVSLIINDRVAVVKVTSADGVHLGQDDGPLEAARAVLGNEVIIGRSTHSPDQALRAQSEGFDYVGVGPVFATPTKPSYQPVGLEFVEFASKNIKIPFVAIGGIDVQNIGQVRQAGAQRVAVVRAVMASENPKAAAQTLLEKLR